jgi:hypothetical protein
MEMPLDFPLLSRPLSAFEKTLGINRIQDICWVIGRLEESNWNKLADPESRLGHIASSFLVRRLERYEGINMSLLCQYNVNTCTTGACSVDPWHYNDLEETASMLDEVDEILSQGGSFEQAINEVAGVSLEQIAAIEEEEEIEY